MKIVLDGENAIILEPTEGALAIEGQSADEAYSPFHMLGSALATCTFSVLYSWATHSKLDAGDLSIRVSWQFAEDPHRVAAIHEDLRWPSLPEDRRAAAERAAALCAVHATLANGLTVDTHLSA